MRVGCRRELLKVNYGQSRVGNALAKDSLCIRSEGSFKLFLCAVRGYECKFDAHLAHCHIEQVESSAIDGGAGDDVVACICNIENREEVGGLARGCQHACSTALHSGDLGCDKVIRRVLQTSVEIAARLKVKELCHIRAGVVLECRALINRDLSRLTVLRTITTLNTFCLNIPFIHYCLLSNAKAPAFSGLYCSTRGSSPPTNQIILSEALREPDNHSAGDFIALLSGVPFGTSDKYITR